MLEDSKEYKDSIWDEEISIPEGKKLDFDTIVEVQQQQQQQQTGRKQKAAAEKPPSSGSSGNRGGSKRKGTLSNKLPPQPIQKYIHIHTKFKESSLKIWNIEQLYPALGEAIGALPARVCIITKNGLYIPKKFLERLWKDPNSVDKYLKRRRLSVERFGGIEFGPLSIAVLRVIEKAKSFLTYDDLLEGLKGFRDPDWGELKPDMGGNRSMDEFPKASKEEEEKEKQRKEAQEAERKGDEQFLKEKREAHERIESLERILKLCDSAIVKVESDMRYAKTEQERKEFEYKRARFYEQLEKARGDLHEARTEYSKKYAMTDTVKR